jgi:hypothetical protein
MHLRTHSRSAAQFLFVVLTQRAHLIPI